MINRREVLVSGIALSVLAQQSSANTIAAPRNTADRLVSRLIADERFRAARNAAHSAAANGISVHWLAEDVTPVYESLDLAWKSTSFAIAGLTTPNALFVIERLAWDRGLRTIRQNIQTDEPQRIDSSPTMPVTDSFTLVSWLLAPKGETDRYT